MAVPSIISGDSADPKKIMLDLQQLAAVCQRLGIDLQKTAALGQTISSGGKGTSPGQTQNPSHAPYHEGGGTGYTNLALGGVVGSRNQAPPGLVERVLRKAAATPNKVSFGLGYEVLNESLYSDLGKGDFVKGTPSRFVPYGHGVIRTHRGELYRVTQGLKRPAPWLKFGELWRTEAIPGTAFGMDGSERQVMGYRSFNHMNSFAYKMTGPSMAYNAGYGYGLGLNARSKFLDILKHDESRKMMKFFMGIEGARSIFNLVTKKINYAAGETFWTNAARETTQLLTSGAMMASGHYIHTVAAPAIKQAFSGAYSRAVGGGVARTFAGTISAGSAAVTTATPVALVAATAFVLTKAIDLTEEDNASRELLKQIKATTSGSMHNKKKTKPMLSPDAEYAFNKNVDEAQQQYKIDPETGERKPRSEWGKWWYNRAFVRLWGRDADAKAEKEWRMKEVGKLHEAAQQKAVFLDWQGAREDVARAKELVVVEEVMPFFWKEPEKYLRQMEASRIAGRNWARAQQPRGGSRTGD